MNSDGDENQNNLNGVPNADPTQQAIFTPVQTPAPEPPRPAQNSSAIVGSVVEPASTGLSHQYYSNHPTKTSASGIGDIVIGRGGNKKINIKKSLIIGSIISICLMVILVIILVISNTQKTSLSRIEQSFNKFANYMVFGKDSTASLTEAYQYGSQYYISHLSSGSERRNFLSSAQEKFQQFYDEYNKNEESTNNQESNESNEANSVTDTDDLLLILDTYKNDLSMELYEQSSPILSANEIMTYYIENPETVDSEIRKYYDAHDSASDEVLAHAAQNIQDANALIPAYRTFSLNGCIAESGRIDNTCLMSGGASLASANQVIESYNTMFSVMSAENYARSIRLYQNIWVIQEKLNEKN